VRLFGAADALRKALGTALVPGELETHDSQLGQARALLGKDAFAAAWAEGRALTVEQAIAEALGETGTGIASPGAAL
jgi:hypothetical protein